MPEQDINIEGAEVLNRNLIDAIIDAPEGHLKSASAAGSKMIRRKLRENGFSRLILPHNVANDEDLQYQADSELPVVVEEMEPESPGAKSISFNNSSDTAFYRADKFVVYFSKIVTPEFTKNVDELRTYKSDLRSVITDNSLKDIQTEEDGRFMATVEEICGVAGQEGDAGAFGASGLQQSFNIPENMTRDAYVELLSYLENRDLNNGVFLMNRKTAKGFLKWHRDEFGGDIAEALALKGLSALSGGEVMGVNHIFTMKRDIVPDNVVYQFTEPDYLGRAYILQNVTMYVEKKKDILKFSAMEKIGLTFANVASVNRAEFGNATKSPDQIIADGG